MRTILIGTDFMYDKVGNLKPIQINTAIGLNSMDRLEDLEFIFDLTELKKFLIEKKFKTVFYIGIISYFQEILKKLCKEIDIEVIYYKIVPPSLTVPHVLDDENTLLIRSAYDTTAIIDDEFCKNRPNFLNLIKENDYATEFVSINYDGSISNNITTIPDNGIHPNFILKSGYPEYERDDYPKLYRVSNMAELNIIMKNVNPNYFLTHFYFNEDKTYNNKIVNIRSMNLLFPPNLESIKIGAFTKECEKTLDVIPEYDDLFMLKSEFRESYLTNDDYSLNIEGYTKEYKTKKLLTEKEITKMNDVLSSIGNDILKNN